MSAATPRNQIDTTDPLELAALRAAVLLADGWQPKALVTGHPTTLDDPPRILLDGRFLTGAMVPNGARERVPCWQTWNKLFPADPPALPRLPHSKGERL